MRNMKRMASILLASIFMMASSVPALAQEEKKPAVSAPFSIDSVLDANTSVPIPEDADYTPGRVLAVVNSGFDQSSLEQLAALKRKTASFSVKKLMELDPGITKIVSIDTSHLATPDLLKMVSAVPGVEEAQPDYTYTPKNNPRGSTAVQPSGTPKAADPLSSVLKDRMSAQTAAVRADTSADTPAYFDRQYFLKDRSDENPAGTNVSYVWDGKWEGTPAAGIQATKGSEDVVVAVLDSGVDYTNPDLAPVMWDGSRYGTAHHGWTFGIPAVDSIHDDPMDTFLHGTHIAGIIAASGKYNVSGMAPNIRILALSFLGSGTTNTYQVIRAYDKIIQLKKQGVNIVAVNDSFGGGAVFHPVISAAVRKAGENGIISVIAAGNDHQNIDRTSIASNSADSRYDLHIGAVTPSGIPADFSNYGEEALDLFAPGEAIWSTVPEKYGITNSRDLNAQFALQSDDWSLKTVRIDRNGNLTEDPQASAVLNGGNSADSSISWQLPLITREILDSGEQFGLEVSLGNLNGKKMPLLRISCSYTLPEWWQLNQKMNTPAFSISLCRQSEKTEKKHGVISPLIWTASPIPLPCRESLILSAQNRFRKSCRRKSHGMTSKFSWSEDLPLRMSTGACISHSMKQDFTPAGFRSQKKTEHPCPLPL